MENITIPNNEIWYTTASGQPFNATSSYALDSLKSMGFADNTIKEDGTYVMSFKKPITTIGDWLFFGSDLNSIVIPEGVTSIGESVFYGCEGLTSITIPDSVTSIGNWVFADCTNLTSIQVESGNPIYDSRNDCNAIIETYKNTLISGCKNTIIPDSVTSIEDGAFHYCTSLTSIDIPDSVTRIGSSAFDGCYNLRDIHYSGRAKGFTWGAFNATIIASDEIK